MFLIDRYAFGQTIQDYETSIDVNYMGVLNTLFPIVPEMIRRKRVREPIIMNSRVKCIWWVVRAVCLAIQAT